MSINPYESPKAAEGLGPPGWSPNQAEKLNVPGLLLIITASVSIACRSLLLIFIVVSFGLVVANGPGGNESVALSAKLVGGVVHHLVGIAFNAVTLFGGIKMRNLESYSLSMAGAIIACIPCCSPCYLVGIPFGIWALVVLADEPVKGAFRS